MATLLLASLTLGLFSAAGCTSCEKSREVPFGLNKEPSHSARSGEEVDAPGAAQLAERLPSLESLTLQAGTDRIRVDGLDYRIPGSSIHLLLELKGAAGDISAALLESDEARYRFKILEKRAGALKVIELLAIERAEACAFKSGSLGLPDPNYLVYAFSEECAFGEGAAAGVANILPSPSLRKAIRVEAPPEEGGSSFSISLESVDRDEDGHIDLVARIAAPAFEPIELSWLNRPGGFMLVDLEPRQSLARLEEAGKSAVDPAVAASSARSLLTLSSALCRESERPRLRVDEHRGLPCGKDYSRVAEGLIVGELLLRGELDAALSLARELRERGDKEVNLILREAFKLLPASAISLRHLPLPSPPLQDAWLRGLAFEEDGTIHLGGASPTKIEFDSQNFDLGSELRPELRPAKDAPFPSRDLLDRFGLVSIESACYGSRAGVRPLRSEDGADSARTKFIPIDEGSGCAPGAVQEEPWEIVGWAPQGLVFERGSVRRIVPLDINASPSGEPFNLSEDEPLPSPILGPRVSRDGETRLVVIPSAILILREGRSNLVIRHESWGDAPEIRAAAISPAGDQLAAIVGGEVYFGKLNGY